MNPAAYVSAELDGVVHRVGRLWVSGTGDSERATFEYQQTWLKSSHRYALEPALSLARGPYHTRAGQPLFGALGDSAPDGWGRNLIARDERASAWAYGREPRKLREVDYLLAVADETRQGALRFSASPTGTFIAERGTGAIPSLRDLPKLAAAVDSIVSDDATANDFRMLAGPGAALSGVRPKCTVRDGDGSLLLAKFPIRTDSHPVVEWEAVALSLADKAGIRILSWRLTRTAANRVLLVRRFDRVDGTRIPFLSAMSALGADPGESRSYVAIAECLRACGSSVDEDLAALWRRIIFTVLISNTDDHLRNHGFLYSGEHGWRLCPAYDLNPVPGDADPKKLTTPIGEDGDFTASLEKALGVAEQFGVSLADARVVISEVSAAVRQWRTEATNMKIRKRDIDRMASAFEHGEATIAASI